LQWPGPPIPEPNHFDFLGTILILFYLYWLYETIVSLRGFFAPAPLPRATTFHRFGILIPAHNEEKVLGSLLESLKEQNYPDSYFDIYVACDSCTDATPQIARTYGASVITRHDPQNPGKTQNIKFALSRIPLQEYDAIAILDADNLAHPDFLARMNDYLAAHPEAEAIQGYLDTKNSHDSWLTRAYTLAYWYTNRFWQLARANWGLSATLGGTGLLIRTSCIRRLGWNLQSLTEDLEFSTKLVLEGGKVHWNEWAITYDEKPLFYRHSHRQRMRWMQGHYFVAWQYGPKLLYKFFVTLQIQYLDYFLYLFNPLLIALSSTLLFAQLGRLALGTAPRQPLFWLSWLFLVLTQNAYQIVIGPSLKEGRFTLRYLPYLFFYIIYGFTWLPVIFYSIPFSRNQKIWVRTEHVRNLKVAEILGKK
jgi:cellulose synthase/poly-beta-1,6-N-acetylglucosamine synthase-like glycosyltransferase